MLETGTILGGRYEILKKIGTGGMADVYMAKCHKLNRNVAIKVLKNEYVDNEKFLKISGGSRGGRKTGPSQYCERI